MKVHGSSWNITLKFNLQVLLIFALLNENISKVCCVFSFKLFSRLLQDMLAFAQTQSPAHLFLMLYCCINSEKIKNSKKNLCFTL